jgi:hypothetical protein
LRPAAPFARTAASALELLQHWEKVARSSGSAKHTPSLGMLQTACRQAGCTLPELEAYARAGAHPQTAFLLCGGDAALATEFAALFGYEADFCDVPDSPLVWSVQSGTTTSLRMHSAGVDQALTPEELPQKISALLPTGSLTTLEEHLNAEAAWRILWIPHPHRCHRDETDARIIEPLLSQRAAVVLSGAPDSLVRMFQGLGQKLWVVTADQLTIEEERQRLLREVGTLGEDGPEQLDLRAAAAWAWLVPRLLEQMEQQKRACLQLANQYEIKLSSSRHLFSQYRKNWSGGIRSLAEAYVQNRTSGQAFAPFFDAGKAGPQTSTYVSALGLTGLMAKLDEFVVDRMADFVTGLTGLAAKLELKQVSLGEAKARWVVRTLGSKLEAALNEKHIFPSDGGKRGGLVGNLTGRKQAVLDDRKGQVLKAARLTVQLIENEFNTWSAALTSTVENGIALQLAAALAEKGYTDAEHVRQAAEGLEKLEQLIQGNPNVEQNHRGIALEWLGALAAHPQLSRYQPAMEGRAV